MSGNAVTVISAEGVHDVGAVSKLLRLKGFREILSLNDVPPPLQDVIPRHYPWKNSGTELNRLVPHPSFLVKDERWVLLSNADGETKLASNLKGILSALHKQYVDTTLCGIAILADADTKTAAGKQDIILRQLDDAFQDSDDFLFHSSKPAEITLYGRTRPLATYIFPDNQAQGTLEGLLIDGARRQYPELLRGAEAYISQVKGLSYAGRLENPSGRNKAITGVIANVLRPGKANQVSIHDDDWFTGESLMGPPSHQALSQFIDTITGWEAA